MKVLKGNNAITLIALIITIILLLILAIVTISAVNEGNLFAHANNAVTKWNDETAKENVLISNYIAYMEKYAKKGNGSSSGLVYNKAYRTEMIIDGTNVEYDFTFFKNCDIAWANLHEKGTPGSIFGSLIQYSYDIDTREMIINGENSILSNDGKTIIFDANSFNLTNQEFQYTVTQIESLDLYNGAYYNAQLNQMILIVNGGEGESALIYSTMFGGVSSGYSRLETDLNLNGVTIKDNRTLVKDGNEYTLLESL